MKRALQFSAILLAIGAIAFWAATGANRGWTRTSEPVKTVDEITGIEGIQYERRFVPGIELLGGALLGSAAIAGVSLFFRKRQAQEKQIQAAG